MTMDLHADQIQGFFEKPVDHLVCFNHFFPYIESLNLENLTIASPDMGGSKRAYAYSNTFEKRCSYLLQTTQKSQCYFPYGINW
jgi:ribose-phosphate pyrophosphokinase